MYGNARARSASTAPWACDAPASRIAGMQQMTMGCPRVGTLFHSVRL